MTATVQKAHASRSRVPARGSSADSVPMSGRDQQKARALGVTSATGLVVGSIIRTGVFTMPAVLASAGTVSLLVLAIIAVGATTLALLFGQLTRRVPSADGGLYAYARHEFGGFAGYLTGWCYWIQGLTVTGNRSLWDSLTEALDVDKVKVLATDKNGIEVVTVAGSELGRGRGGPRCMTCPI